MEGRNSVGIFEEFIALFGAMTSAAKRSPKRLVAFYSQSKEITEAVTALQQFLWRTDFERRVFHGSGKIIARAPSNFVALWDEYDRSWSRALAHIALQELVPEAKLEFEPSEEVPKFEPVPPDPESEESFDPLWHDGGAALELGIERLDIEAAFVTDERNSNACRLALGAYDYLAETIGFNARDIFRRWRNVPVFFMPAHVSNRYGLKDKGSLRHLLDDGVRAYVFGAPAAALAMCRAADEMLRKEHYKRGELENVIVQAGYERDHVENLKKKANEIMHNYQNRKRLGPEDDRTIINFLATLKYLIERAPGP